MKAVSVRPIETLRDWLQRDSVIIPFYAIHVGVMMITEKRAIWEKTKLLLGGLCHAAHTFPYCYFILCLYSTAKGDHSSKTANWSKQSI